MFYMYDFISDISEQELRNEWEDLVFVLGIKKVGTFGMFIREKNEMLKSHAEKMLANRERHDWLYG